MISLDHDDLLHLEKYYRISLINKLSGIRSANLIGTQDAEGRSNLALFNSVTHIGANPPYLGFLMRPLSGERHTYHNIKAHSYFTINQVTTAIHQKAHQTSANFPAGQSEFGACGLSEWYLEDFPAPFVAESPIKIGLSFQEEHLIKANNTIFMVGKIEQVLLPENLIGEDGDLNLEEADAVGIGGLDTYYRCQKLGRYQYARVNQEVTKIETD